MTSNIAKFFAGRSVFITGGAGFVGKQVTEKLLRSCPEIDTVYVLMRAKKGVSAEQRLQQATQSPVFDILRQKQPDFSKKIVPIVGDVLHDFLGISDADHNRLSSNVSVLIHSAATLSFVEPLRVAVDMNVLGVRRALEVSKTLPQINAFVHISTAYSQVDRRDDVIEEKVYDPPLPPEKAIEMTRLLTDEELASLTPTLLKRHNRPNTYTLTKAIAETLVNQEHEHVPACVVRPSIITASQAEPFPGWVDNFTAANGVFTGLGTGTLRSVFTTRPNGQPCRLDCVPVDRVANGVIVAAWHTATNRSTLQSKDIPIFNITSQKFHTVQRASELMLKFGRRYRFSKLPASRYLLSGIPASTENWVIYQCLQQVYLPLRFKMMDLALMVTGKKPQLFKVFEKTRKLSDVLLFFSSNGFVWADEGLMGLQNQLNDVDKKEFICRLDDLDMMTYYDNWWYGLRKYALKDKKCEIRQLLPAVKVSEQSSTSKDFTGIKTDSSSSRLVDMKSIA